MPETNTFHLDPLEEKDDSPGPLEQWKQQVRQVAILNEKRAEMLMDPMPYPAEPRDGGFYRPTAERIAEVINEPAPKIRGSGKSDKLTPEERVARRKARKAKYYAKWREKRQARSVVAKPVPVATATPKPAKPVVAKPVPSVAPVVTMKPAPSASKMANLPPVRRGRPPKVHPPGRMVTSKHQGVIYVYDTDKPEKWRVSLGDDDQATGHSDKLYQVEAARAYDSLLLDRKLYDRAANFPDEMPDSWIIEHLSVPLKNKGSRFYMNWRHTKRMELLSQGVDLPMCVDVPAKQPTASPESKQSATEPEPFKPAAGEPVLGATEHSPPLFDPTPKLIDRPAASEPASGYSYGDHDRSDPIKFELGLMERLAEALDFVPTATTRRVLLWLYNRLPADTKEAMQ